MQAFLTMNPEELSDKSGYVFMVTKKGTVKKTSMDQFENIRTSGIQAINLESGDSLIFAGITNGEDEVLVTTSAGSIY
jgi:DNA gyrase subunit A